MHGNELDPLRICLIKPELAVIKPQGGIGRHTETLARGFARRGHKVTVAAFGLHRPPRMEHEWGTSLDLNFARGSYFSFVGLRGAMAVRQFLQRHGDEFDVVETTNFWGPGAFAPPLPIPYLVRLSSPIKECAPQGDYGARVWNWLEARTVRRADLVLANSVASWEACRRYYALQDMPRRLVPYGIADVPADDLSPSPSEIQILVIGRAEFRKGTDILIRALAEVMPKYECLRFVSVGWETDGLMKKFPAVRGLWRNLCQACGDRIETLGRVDDPEKIRALRRSHWLLVPSRYESFGWVVIEAMRAGTPVIASSGGGLPEVCGRGPHNIIYGDPGNPATLADALARLCELGPAYAISLRPGTRAAYESCYREEQFVEATLDAYGAAIQEKNGNLSVDIR